MKTILGQRNTICQHLELKVDFINYLFCSTLHKILSENKLSLDTWRLLFGRQLLKQTIFTFCSSRIDEKEVDKEREWMRERERERETMLSMECKTRRLLFKDMDVSLPVEVSLLPYLCLTVHQKQCLHTLSFVCYADRRNWTKIPSFVSLRNHSLFNILYHWII